MANDGHQIKNPQDALRFLLAGKATLTLVSKVTGNRYTYKVGRSKTSPATSPLFVSLMTGSDNERSYRFMATIFEGKHLRWSKRSKVAETHQGAIAFSWIFMKLAQGEMPSTVEFWHSGKCGKCGKKLTVPSSIASGLGPICAGVMPMPKPKK